MIRGLQLDCGSGIAGDMFLAALLDLGLDLDALDCELKKLGVDNVRLERREVLRGAIRATKFDVVVTTADGRERVEGLGEDHRSSDHGHSGDHHHHDNDHDHVQSHDHDHGLSYREIESLIQRSGLSDLAKARAQRIFLELGQAEARVHGESLDSVHFHEVGAADSIVDICGAAVALELLGVSEIRVTDLGLGQGTRRMAHGTLPIPVPATLEILRGLPVRHTGIRGELVTPTGAAILKGLQASFEVEGESRVLATGYGAGNTDRSDPPNVLRATLYERALDDEPLIGSERIGRTEVGLVELIADLDDASGEELGFLRDRLESAGALDLSFVALAMKKGRPGHRLCVLSRAEDATDLQTLILRESPTLGVRSRRVNRQILDRRIETLETAEGPVRLKIADLGEGQFRIKAEYEDVAALAKRLGRSFAELAREIENAMRARIQARTRGSD